MAIGIEIRGRWLNLYEDTSVTIQDESDFTSVDKLISKAYTMPFKIPTQSNRHALKNAHRPGSLDAAPYIENVHIYMGTKDSIGVATYVGVLYILRSDEVDTECSFVSNEHRITEKKFSNVDMGTYQVTTGPAVNADGSLNTNNPVGVEHVTIGQNPDDYNHVLVPVVSRPEGDKEGYIGATVINRYQDNYLGTDIKKFMPWDLYGDVSNLYKKVSGFSPFLRIDYIFEKIGEALGYGIVNQITEVWPELQRMYLFNNNDLSGVVLDEANDNEVLYAYWPDLIEYNRCVPDEMSLTEFLKIYADAFFCGIFVDNVERRIDIIPYVSIINAPYQHDLTSNLIGGVSVSTSEIELPTRIEYATDENENINNYPPHYLPATDFYWSGPSPADGNYYDVAQDRYFTAKGGTKLYHPHIYRGINTGIDKGKQKVIKSRPMRVEFNPVNTIEQPVLSYNGATNQRLDILRWFIYRGWSTESWQNGPSATSNGYDVNTDTDGYTSSLLLDRDNGIYERLGKEWVGFLSATKTVEMTLSLTIGQISKIKPWHKIKVGSNHYLIKYKSVSIGMNGLSNVKVVGLVVN